MATAHVWLLLCLVWIFMKQTLVSKVCIFWDGHKVLRNLHGRFVLCIEIQIYGGDFAKLCGLLRIYELYDAKEDISNQDFLKFKLCTFDNSVQFCNIAIPQFMQV